MNDNNKEKSESNQIKMLLLLVILFLFNINANGVNTNWNEKSERLFLDSIASPPSEMESFYIVDSNNEEDPFYIYQMDAFEIANYFSRKTINGYYGSNPRGWDRVWEVEKSDYIDGVKDWISKNELKNVYAYDRAKNQWIKHLD